MWASSADAASDDRDMISTADTSFEEDTSPGPSPASKAWRETRRPVLFGNARPLARASCRDSMSLDDRRTIIPVLTCQTLF